MFEPAVSHNALSTYSTVLCHGENFLQPLNTLLKEAGLENATQLIHERVVSFAETRLRIKVEANLTLSSIPKTTLTEKIEKLEGASANRWPKVYIETPLRAVHALRQIASLNPARMPFETITWHYDPLYDLYIPAQLDLRDTIAKALLVTHIISTKATFDRDDLLGFLLRIWQTRERPQSARRQMTADKALKKDLLRGREVSSRPRKSHTDAWRLLAKINGYYSCLYEYIDADRPTEGLIPIPLAERIQEEVFDYSSRHQHRSISLNKDLYARVVDVLKVYRPRQAARRGT